MVSKKEPSIKEVVEAIGVFSNRVDEQFKRVDERFNRVDEQFKRVDERFNRVDEQFKNLEDKMHDEFNNVYSELRNIRVEIEKLEKRGREDDEATAGDVLVLKKRVDELEKQFRRLQLARS